MLKVRERVPGIKKILMSFPGRTEFTVDEMKHYYAELYGEELKGDSFANWIGVFNRGLGWDFAEKVVFHKNCSMLEFQYTSNEHLVLRNGNYLRHAFH